MSRKVILALLLLAVPCWALTTITVNPGGGADYTTTQDANNALPNPLDDDYLITCSGATDDTTQTTIAPDMGGYTLTIRGDATSGLFDDSKYQIKVSYSQTAITLNASGVTLENLQLTGIGASTYSRMGISVGGSYSNITIRNCLIQDFLQSGSYAGIRVGSGTGANKRIYNNVIWNCVDGISVLQGGNAEIYNNTIVDCTRYGLRVYKDTGDTIIAKNNLISGSDTADWLTEGTAGTLTTAKNFTADGSSPDAGCANATITFAGGEDFHLDASMNQDLRGVSLAGTFTVDIDGDTRAWWDPGADELSDPPTGPTIQQTWWGRRRQ